MDLMSTRTVLLIYMQGIPGCVPWSIITVFLSDYLSADKGLTVQLATVCMMTFGVGALCGQLFGGWAGQQLYNKDKKLQCLFMGAATALGSIPFFYVITSELHGPSDALLRPVFFGALFLNGLLSAITGPNVRSVLQVS
jgi:predicted MFS family arabinose efflux permease